MTKKCDHCKKPIDVYKGSYLNMYTETGESYAYHRVCYEAMVMEWLVSIGKMEVLMLSEKCQYCGKGIDTQQGNYINIYTKPGELHAYHTSCYRAFVIHDWREEARF